jgi:diamine N-acetyltransferase
MYYLWRLMITAPKQGKGFGRRAMEQVIDYVRSRPGATELIAGYFPMPGSPWPFCRSLVFESTGKMEHGEMVIRLKL